MSPSRPLAQSPCPGPSAEVDVPQEVFQHTLANGLTLLAEPMDHVRSVALNFMLPAGCSYDPPDRLGLGNVLAELTTRGAGDLDSRALTLALDNLGLDRGEGVGVLSTRFWGATVSRNLPDALELYADILRRPHLDEDELESVKALAVQELHGIEDDPRALVLIRLRKHHYPTPFSNDHRGTLASIEALTADDVRAHHARFFRPRGAILSIAGKFDWNSLRDQVERLLGDWEGSGPSQPPPGPGLAKQAHLTKELEQTHIALAYNSVPLRDPDYYAALGAVNVLSGSMSSRLFTEIREKEGLCYTVSASYSPLRDRASIFAHAGSRNERAQLTLDLLLRELRRLPEGIETEEVERVQVGLKASLIMAEESTSSRASALASDWYHLGRVRSFDEIQAAIKGLTADIILQHVRRLPPQDFTIVTLGPQPLTVDGMPLPTAS